MEETKTTSRAPASDHAPKGEKEVEERLRLNLRSSFNLHLTCTVSVICISQIAYGFETQGYAAIQSLDAFVMQFGDFDESTGEYYYDSTWLAMFNAFGLLGLLVGEIDPADLLFFPFLEVSGWLVDADYSCFEPGNRGGDWKYC